MNKKADKILAYLILPFAWEKLVPVYGVMGFLGIIAILVGGWANLHWMRSLGIFLIAPFIVWACGLVVILLPGVIFANLIEKMKQRKK